MPTISGLRRRGYTPASIRDFADRIGVAKSENTVEIELLEFCIREDLNKTATRAMAVLDPLKVVIENYPEDQVEMLEFINNPEDASAGTRLVPFSKEIYIERSDFMEDPPRKFFRLKPGGEVRLRYAYFIKCNEVIKNDNGEIIELRCSYDPASNGGQSPDGRKVRGTIHWVSARHAADVEVRLYDKLFLNENPNKAEEGKTFLDNVNPESLKIVRAKVEPMLADAQADEKYQFERTGYFCVDTKHSSPGNPVFNRTVTLRDSWKKITGQK
jgi:glutaminyl-tRNA synthetase